MTAGQGRRILSLVPLTIRSELFRMVGRIRRA